MKRYIAGFVLLVATAWGTLVSDVRALLGKHDLANAEHLVSRYRHQNGDTPESWEALSWLARGALDAGQLDRAAAYAEETQKGALAALARRRPDADSHLAKALGASLEVQAEILTRRGQRAEAVSFLRKQRLAYRGTAIESRIQKNINLLTLEGRPAPPLDVRQWLGPQPRTLAELRGHPVLLFFWAHWCSDCKDELPVIEQIRSRFGPKGLVVVGPTQHYGYVARGEEAPPEVETRYIDQVRRTVYAPLKDMPVPLGEDNFRAYGSSTVPTIVLIDRAGIVRLYHPDVMPYAELGAAVQKLMQ